MTAGLIVWVCTLPFVFLLMVPWRGFRVALITAVLLLGGLTVVCWAMCTWGRSTPGGARHTGGG